MKRIAILLIATLMVVNSNAQIFVKSTGQSITEDAVKGCIVVVKQAYQLREDKTGKTYGRNSKNEFGCNFTIGVKTNQGLVVTDNALKPWNDDANYKKVSSGYTPFISRTETRNISESEGTFKQQPLKMTGKQPEGLYIAQTDDSVPSGMEIDYTSGNKKGWLIWIESKKSMMEDLNTSISINSISKEMEFKNGQVEYAIDAPANEKNVIGGIYVCPQFPGNGQVNFCLVGIITLSDGKWKLTAPFTTADESSEEETKISEVKENEMQEDDELDLTPVDAPTKKKNKKNKK